MCFGLYCYRLYIISWKASQPGRLGASGKPHFNSGSRGIKFRSQVTNPIWDQITVVQSPSVNLILNPRSVETSKVRQGRSMYGVILVFTVNFTAFWNYLRHMPWVCLHATGMFHWGGGLCAQNWVKGERCTEARCAQSSSSSFLDCKDVTSHPIILSPCLFCHDGLNFIEP